MIGPRDMGAGTPAPGRSHLETLSYNEYNAGIHHGNKHGQQHGHGQRHGDAPRTPAQRLIDQYERLSTPPPTSPSPLRDKSTYRRQYVSDRSRPVNDDANRRHAYASGYANTNEAPLKKEGKSPIRQSLRNLLSVIKKGAEGIGKRKSDDRLLVPGAEGAGPPYQCKPNAPPLLAAAVAKAQRANPQKNNSIPTRRRMTGALLYLTRTTQLLAPELSGPLVWTMCSVTIDGNKLVVSSFVGDIESTVHEIVLSRCTDIRSLSPTQMTSAELDALARVPEGDKMRAFEVLFQGQQREVFATKSVKERAGWISAIWDAILPDQKENPPEVPPGTKSAPAERDNKAVLPIESPTPKPLPHLSPLLVQSRSQRSLPPLPPPSPALPLPLSKDGNKHNPANLHIDLSDLQGPISPSIYPPTSHLPSLPGSHPSTPSSIASASSKNPNWHVNRRTPTLYPPSSMRSGGGSYFVASPTSMTTQEAAAASNSCPSSPSVANLSQLSVVRQRLAQIERKHSQISGYSGKTTPLPSPGESVWSMREAVFHNAGSRSKPTSPVASISEDRPVIVPQTEVMDTQADDNKDGSTHNTPLRIDKALRESEKPGSSKEDVSKISRGIIDIKGVLGGASGQPTVHQMVMALEHHARGGKKALRNIQDTLKTIGERVDNVATVERNKDVQGTQAVVIESNEKVMILLKEVKERIASDLPALASKLDDIKQEQRISTVNAISTRNSESSSADNKDSSGSIFFSDLQPVLNRLEEIRALFSHSTSTQGPENKDPEQSKHTQKILDIIQEHSKAQALLSQQQADSVRYLNELNSWLEAFVNSGTSQIQGISSNLDRLCRELGFNESTSAPNQSQPGGIHPNLVNDIRQLVAGMKARDQNFTALQGAVHSLLDVLTASQTQNGAAPQVITGLMQRQHHDQEILLRAFTNEISGEIKGERLRFVEAMKEATAINVQLHVEQFKQEIGHEVMGLADEVGRLHREKQHIENQISDLFSFYSKHKQADMPLQTIPENIPLTTPVRQVQAQERVRLPRSHNRLQPHQHHQ